MYCPLVTVIWSARHDSTSLVWYIFVRLWPSVLMLLELKNLNKAYRDAASKHKPTDEPFTIMQAVKVRHGLICSKHN